MKMISAITLLSLSAIASPAQPGPDVERRFDVRGFNGIALSGCDIATVTLGSGYAVTARGRTANIDQLRIDTDGSTLRIRRKENGCNGRDRRVAIAITMPKLAAVELSGATELNLPAIDVRAFEAEASGAGVLRMAALRSGEARFGLSGAAHATVSNLHADRLSVDLSGASVLRAGGDARRLAIGGSGASDADTRALAAPDLTISASGTTKVRAGAAQRAQVGASGMANVSVEGHPHCAIAKSGLARVTCG